MAFSTNFCPFEIDRKLYVFKNSPKSTIFGIFNDFLATQNIDVACFARNIEWDFFCDFQTPFNGASYSSAEKVMNSKGIPFNWVAFCDYTLASGFCGELLHS